MNHQTRLVLFGNGSRFSNAVFDGLIKIDLKPCALALPSYAPTQPAGMQLNVENNRRLNGFESRSSWFSIPLIYAPKGRQDYLNAELEFLAADYLLVACWPYLLPHSCTKQVSKAALNLHPSLLPKYAGPRPVFEQLANKENPVGITLHLLGPEFDGGDIISRQSIDAGIKGFNAELFEDLAASKGVKLFSDAIARYGSAGWQPVQQKT